MFCSNCGSELREADTFCARCGKPARAAAAAAGPGPARAPRRLARRMWEKQIAGVCAGVAAYLNIDATLLRVLWLVLTICTGFVPGLLAYVVCWILMPKEYGPQAAGGIVAPTPGA